MSYLGYSDIVTIGDTPYPSTWFNHYPTLDAAVAGVDAESLIIVGGVNTSNRVTFDKTVSVRGMPGASLVATGSTIFRLVDLGHLRVEGLECVSLQNQTAGVMSIFSETTKLHAYRCFMGVSSPSIQGRIIQQGENGDNNRFVFEHCTLRRGQHTFSRNAGSFLVVHKPSFALRSVWAPPSFIVFGDAGAQSWGEFDVHSSDTELAPYGHEYGTEGGLIPLPPLAEITSRAIDVPTGRPVRVVAFDWQHPQRHVTTVPDSDHYWSLPVPKGTQFGLYYLSQDARNPPIIHGPYTED